MANAAHIRGALLEEVVLALLNQAGYRTLSSSDAGIEDGRGGQLYVIGRGGRHQVDAIVGNDNSPAFTYPMRLIVEAKAYLPTSRGGGRVGLSVIRSVVGVAKDINENSFTYDLYNKGELYNIKRFIYHFGIFSLSGFTKDAEIYAIAHAIYLFQYQHNSLFDNIRKLLLKLTTENISEYFKILMICRLFETLFVNFYMIKLIKRRHINTLKMLAYSPSME